VIEHTHPLHGSVGKPLRERAIAWIERRGSRTKDAIGVRTLLERTQNYLEGDLACS
jgi:hypothetical protein